MVREIMNSRLIQVLLLLVMATAAPAFGQTNETDLINKGMDFYNQDKFEEAIQAYDKVIEINPRNAEAYNNKGTALGVLGKYSEALQAFEKAKTINSSYAEAWYNMGVIFDLQGKYYPAIQAYNEATRINPEYQKAWIAKNRDIEIIGMKNYLELIHRGYA
jgi:tetratricopeptide (TPR) repeat protein